MQPSSDLSSVFRKTQDSVVQITSHPDVTTQVLKGNALISQTTAYGSGFVYDKKGHIITNNHVIGGNNIIYVKFTDGNIFSAKVIGTDPFTDLAVLQISDNFSNENLVPLAFGNSSLLQVGQQVAAIGNPFGLQNVMTQGIISSLHALLPSNQTDFLIPDIIVTDVPLNPGNSGGPLLDMRGEIIGMNTAIAYANQFPDISYSISSNFIQRIIAQLIAHGHYKHPWFGVTGASLTPDLEDGNKIPTNYKGVVILSVQPNSPAAKSGLRPNTVGQTGDIILAIDGHPLKRFADIINYIESKSVGDNIGVKLLRNGTIMNMNIILIQRPKPIPLNVREENLTTTTITTPILSKPALSNWTKIIHLSNNGTISQGPRLAADGNNLYAIWEESQNGGNRIIFARSTDQGNTFSKLVNLTTGIRIDSETPNIAVFQKNVYVVWTDDSKGNFDIFFTKSTDGGNTFSKPLNLSNNPGLSYQPSISIDENNTVYIVWTDNSQGNYNILFAKSVDNGDTFTKPIALGNTNGVSNFPSITTLGNNTVYIVWSHKNNTDFNPSNTQNQTQTYDVFFTRTFDRGNTISKPVNLSEDPANSQSPVVAVSGRDNVYVLWTDNSIGTYETFFTRSLDGGSTFSKVSVISSNIAKSISLSISTYGNKIFAVWSDNTFGNSEIFFTKSIDNGSTFNMPIQINNDSGTSSVAQITIAPQVSNLYLIWQDDTTGKSMVYFTKTRLTEHLNAKTS